MTLVWSKQERNKWFVQLTSLGCNEVQKTQNMPASEHTLAEKIMRLDGIQIYMGKTKQKTSQ